jgi:septal ring factor EnvC (AmiA/AmiB activator)
MASLKLRVNNPLVLALAVTAAWAALALASDDASADLQSRIDSTQSRIDQSRARENTLAGDVAAFSGLIGQLQAQVDVLQSRENTLQAELDARRAQLERIQTALARERALLARLRARLAYSKRVLSRRLIEIYKSGRPDVITVILSAKGFADLLEREEFIKRINRQDAAIIFAVRAAKDAAKRASDNLTVLEARQRAATVAVELVRNQVAAMKQLRLYRQAAAEAARSERASALGAVRAGRQADQHTLQGLQARLDALGASTGGMSLGPNGKYVIPWNIVNCESGGRNTGPNSAGASGYYQIIPSTWQLFGGKGPAANNAPKSEQDRVASKIWSGGSGAGNWDCAHMVG